MAVHTHVSDAVLGGFISSYDVGALISAEGILAGVENTNYRVETTQGRFVLTLYERRVDAADLPYFIALLDHLAVSGLPVPPVIKDREGTAIKVLADRPACLIRFLQGEVVTNPTAEQARAAGAALAGVHLAGANFAPRRPNTMGIAAWPKLNERCGPSLDAIEPGLYRWLGEQIAAVERAWPHNLSQGTIHADLFPDNVLMTGDHVTGLIDFYFACTDLLAYDLAVMHSAWTFDAAGEPDWAIGDALIAGYQERRSLTPGERVAFGTLAIGACLRFTLSRAWDWLNTPESSIVTRKDPLAYVRRLRAYQDRVVPLA